MSYTPASELQQRLRIGAARGLTRAAVHVQGGAVERVPVEYGDLESSLVVTAATPDDLESAVSSDSPYAVAQHERLDYHHDDGQAKYLEGAALEARSEIEQLMAQAVREVME